MYDDLYLMHHGIKGMHWGVRRYQNEDGTRTPAGKNKERSFRKIVKPIKELKNDEEFKKKVKTGAKIAAGVLVAGAAAYALNKTDRGLMGYYSMRQMFPESAQKQMHKLEKVQAKAYKKINPKYITSDEKHAAYLKSFMNNSKTAARSLVDKNAYVAKSSLTGRPSEATREILEANQAYKMKQMAKNGVINHNRNKSTKLNKKEQIALNALYSAKIKELQKQNAKRSIDSYQTAESIINATNDLIQQFG